MQPSTSISRSFTTTAVSAQRSMRHLTQLEIILLLLARATTMGAAVSPLAARARARSRTRRPPSPPLSPSEYTLRAMEWQQRQ
ncbi:unnamed protein product [Aureobasidium vineae]|uniref:Uncharacterized protein n=1 Tax=Aureobasidium vineae TaxID=2773715 RepID=A0A9N8PHI3_9PEZI|nr:unnamed protein product [Aureobasidium vineae]